MIRTVILLLYLALISLLVGPLLILYGVCGGSMERYYWIGVQCVLFPVRRLGVRTRVLGLENIPAGACLFAANHSSYIDPMIIVGATPRRIAILAKKSLFRIPIMGTAFRIAHFVPVDRADPASAMSSIREGAGYMKQGLSYLIYPEGTRSRDGRLLPFKRAGFALAIEAKVPVVPIACAGAHHVWPKGSFGIRAGEVTVRFCPPIDATAYAMNQREQLSKDVRAAIAAALPAEQQPFASGGKEVSAARES